MTYWIGVMLYLMVCGVVTKSLGYCRGMLRTPDMCRDGTDSTPCCGIGRCNVLCLNCDGGCREGDSVSIETVEGTIFFQCPKHVVNRSIESLVENCSLVPLVYTDKTESWSSGRGIELSRSVVEMPEVQISEEFKCFVGMGNCNADTVNVKSFTITTSYSVTGTGEAQFLPIPMGFSASYGKEWSREVGTEAHYQCGGLPGTKFWLTLRPKFYKVHAIKSKKRWWNANRLLSELYYVFVPMKRGDGTIAGERACRCRYANGTMCPDNFVSGGEAA